jgi:hypothetical protein
LKYILLPSTRKYVLQDLFLVTKLDELGVKNCEVVAGFWWLWYWPSWEYVVFGLEYD